MSKQFDRVAILGVGLLGGSMGLAMRFRGIARHIVGCSRTSANLREAVRVRAIHEYTTDPIEAVAGADLVLLAAPVRTIIALGKLIAPHVEVGALVTDVGSTKVGVVAELDEAFSGRARFIGGHPMAGSDRAGVRYSRGDLLHRAAYFLTPTSRTDADALEAIKSLALELGCRPHVVSPAQHDQLVAAISHLPHVASAALTALVPELCGRSADVALAVAAGGFADTTRVAGADPVLWTQIALENKIEVSRATQALRRKLASFEAALATEDEQALQAFFGEGQEVRRAYETKTPLVPPRERPIIAIDGPAGAGKSSVARAVASQLGFTYVDTGAMYRAVALAAMRAGVSLARPVEIADLAADMTFEFRRGPDGASRMCMNGEDVEDAIRTPEISRLASPVSAVPAVRETLVAVQRAMGEQGGIVMEGRDIQTVVFPDAEVKVFLTASDRVRAERRRLQLLERGIEQPLEEILDEMRERDERDSTRAVAPLSQAADATRIDTDGLTFEEVASAVSRLVRAGM